MTVYDLGLLSTFTVEDYVGEILMGNLPAGLDLPEDDERLVPRCAGCKGVIEDRVCFDGEGYFCEPCMEAEAERIIPGAEAYAAENCVVTSRLEKYDRSLEYRCTPEEYESGMKESYSPNSYRAHFRHDCTSYDRLIKALDRDSLAGRIYYLAIRERVDSLFAKAVERLGGYLDSDGDAHFVDEGDEDEDRYD